VQENKLTIQISKPVNEVFVFTITPPNSTRWIPDVITEETNEWPICVGTVYKLQTKKGIHEVFVTAIKENEIMEWVSKDKNYHCRYSYKSLDENTTELEYYEWKNQGQLDEPFSREILKKLKAVVEA